ncbi:MAG: type II secretion system F family protein [Pseudomonadota bacterium]
MEFLQPLNDLLIEKLGPLGPLYALGLLGTLMVLLTLPIFLNQRKDPLDKLKQANRHVPKGDGESLRFDSKSGDKLDKYSKFLEPEDEGEYSAVRLKLVQAGYRSKSAVRAYNFAQFALGIGFLIVGVLVAILTSATGEPTPQALIGFIMVPGIVGYMLPKYWVTKRQQQRQEEITNGFPDALDMMLVCVEAGQSMDQSIIRVSREIRAGFPALAMEFETVAHEMKAGKDRVQVLRDMSERAGVTDVSSFVTVLIQSTTFGTSIAEALRVYAAEMRDKRVMRAEEKANVLPTKLTLGTMMFTVPPLMIILIGPSVYNVYVTLTSGAAL